MTSPSPSTDKKQPGRSGGAGAKPVAADMAAANAAEVRAVIDNDPGEALGAKVVRVDGTIDAGSYDESDGEKVATLKEPLLEEFFFPDTKRPSYRIKYPAGMAVPVREIEAYNADTELQNRLRGLKPGEHLDPQNPAGIDSTTLASGTYPGVTEGQRKAVEGQ